MDSSHENNALEISGETHIIKYLGGGMCGEITQYLAPLGDMQFTSITPLPYQ